VACGNRVTVLRVGLVAAAAARVRDGCACAGAICGPPVGAELVFYGRISDEQCRRISIQS
jgi:hypothetical protein